MNGGCGPGLPNTGPCRKPCGADHEALDLAGLRARWLLPALSAALGLASAWVFQSVLSQAEAAQGWITGGGVALFVALMVGLVLRLRDDGVASAGATLGLGVAVGVSAILSASLGTLMNGISLAVAGGALLLLQFVRATPLAAGWTGSLTTGAAAALPLPPAPSCWPKRAPGPWR